MRYLVTGSQMKAIDRHAIQVVGIPSVVLMERAALAVAETAEELFAEMAACAGERQGCRDSAGERWGSGESAGARYGCRSGAGGRQSSTGESQSSSENAGKQRICHDGAGTAGWAAQRSVWAVCGNGNNGADGIAAARLLYNKGYKVTVILAGNPQRGTEEFRIQHRIAENLGMQVVEWEDFLPGTCDILIDAVFGVGLSRPVEGRYAEVLNMIAGAGAKKVVAVDMPSGIHSDSGQVMGCAVRADVTVTFGYEKLGSVLYPGRDFCGRVKVCDIGFPAESISLIEGEDTVAVTYGPEDLARMPARPAYSNKGTFGKVLVAAGSANMGGAAYLSALAAYRTGAGLVKIMTDQANRPMMQQLLPEAVLDVYSPEEIEQDPDAFHKKVERECAWADVIVLGPGVGQEPWVRVLMQEFLTNAYVPMILDADSLNAAARYPELAQYFTENIIVTPHMGEMSRLVGMTVEQIRRDIAAVAAEYSARYGITCVLKDAATVVCGREGQLYVNSSGNSCMAKAGSGDVLTGVIAGLLAQGGEPWDAAALGVYLHGLAGDRIRERSGARGMLARELADEIGRINEEG